MFPPFLRLTAFLERTSNHYGYANIFLPFKQFDFGQSDISIPASGTVALKGINRQICFLERRSGLTAAKKTAIFFMLE
jgi:hypothetical protein